MGRWVVRAEERGVRIEGGREKERDKEMEGLQS